MGTLVDQATTLRRMISQSQTGRARLLAVTSGKGGVGKTSLSVNLAIRLAMMGRRIVLLDADLGTANADVLCNLSPAYTLAHVVAGRCTLEQAMVEAPGGFWLIPGASGIGKVALLNEFEREKLVEQLRQLQCEADLIMIDTGAGVGPNVLSFVAAADEILVVTTPEPTAVTDAYAMIKTLQRQGTDANVRVLVNMVKDAAEGRAVFDRIEAVCRRFLNLTPRFAGHVMMDARVPMAVRQRRPFVVDSPRGDAARCITELAHRMDRNAPILRDKGLLRRMATWLAG